MEFPARCGVPRLVTVTSFSEPFGLFRRAMVHPIPRGCSIEARKVGPKDGLEFGRQHWPAFQLNTHLEARKRWVSGLSW